MQQRKLSVFIVTSIFLIILLRIPSFLEPIWNIDEAVEATVGTVVLDGGVPYKDAISHRSPIIYYLYAAVFLISGPNNTLAVHVALILLVVTVNILIFSICNKIAGYRCAVFGSICFVIISSFYQIPAAMFALNTEWVVVFFEVIGMLLLLNGLEQGNSFVFLFWAGCSFCFAMFSKQSALLDFFGASAFLTVYAALTSHNEGTSIPRRIVKLTIPFLSGFGVITAFFVIFFLAQHAFREFWFYVYTYNTKYYLAGFPLSKRMSNLIDSFFSITMPFNFGLFVLLGILAVFYNTRSCKTSDQCKKSYLQWLFVCLAATSLLGSLIGGRDWGHYYIPIIPSWCILIGIGIDSFLNLIESILKDIDTAKVRVLKSSGVILLVFFLLVPSLKSIRIVFQSLQNNEWATGELTFQKPIKYLKENVVENERIFVWGFYPQMYVLTNKKPASRFVFCNFLTGLSIGVNDNQSGKTEKWAVPGAFELLLNDLEKSRAKFIIDTSPSGYMKYQLYPIQKYKLLSDYIEKNYVLDQNYHSQDNLSESNVKVYRRNQGR